MLRLRSSDPSNWNVCLVTDRQQTAGRDLVSVAEQALEGGVEAIQLREKDLGAGDLFRLGERLIPLTRAAGAALLVNDRADVAIALGADAVHLTRGSLPIRIVRSLVGPSMRIGISCHGLEDVREAVEAQADYIFLGPIYETPSKAAYGAPIGLDVLRRAHAAYSIPILAIGGICADRVNEVLDAGAHGIAVISAILTAPDPRAAAQALSKQFLPGARTSRPPRASRPL
jgi:thiamine-phosphate pyrophosphorylase